MEDSKIGMNYAFFKKEVHLGDKVGSFGTKKEAIEAAKQHKGSEIISQKGTEWEVDELKNQSITLGKQTDIEKYDKDDIAFDTNNLKERNMEKVEISFVEDDNDYVPPPNAKKPLNAQEIATPPEGKNKIGMNYTFMNKEIDLGKKLGTFNSKEAAVSFAQKHTGSEIISQKKDGKWEVRDLKEKSPILGKTLDITKYSEFNISFDTYKLKQKDMNNVSVSFVDEDLKK